MGKQDRVVAAIESAVAENLKETGRTIRVTWLPAGVLSLEGEVESLADKHRAGEAAQAVAGRVPLDNALGIAYHDDGELSAAASAALHGSGIASLGVHVVEGIAHLGGRAEGLAVVRQAREAVSRVPGIRGIRHDGVLLHLDREREELENLASLDDWDILVGARAKLDEGLPRSLAGQIVATCRNAVVTLTGVVAKRAVKELAEKLARGAYGVDAVRNLIMIRESPPPRADDLEGSIRKAIGLEGEDLGPADVRVYRVEDVAYLVGSVQYQESALLAMALARDEPGVSQVFDHLRIRKPVY